MAYEFMGAIEPVLADYARAAAVDPSAAEHPACAGRAPLCQYVLLRQFDRDRATADLLAAYRNSATLRSGDGKSARAGRHACSGCRRYGGRVVRPGLD